ncbi:MAG: glycosyltransferase family 4 protein [Lachnospiraceae bacterium]|nr:glycosyltransferase family 4 protein [Lachnospiraceae bacterium]
MSRTFIFAYQPCYGETGGGQGVVYRLYQANKKYSLLNNAYFVFGDRVIQGNNDSGPLAEKKKKSSSVVKAFITRNIPGFVKVRQYEKNYLRLQSYMKKLGETYHFTCDDIYIFHDLQFARSFVNLYSFPKCIMVIHTQGSFYNEWRASHGYDCIAVKKYYESCYEQIISNMHYIGFPSEGAKNSFFESENELRKYEAKCQYCFLYNGVNCPDINLADCSKWIKELQRFKGYIFTTVATLNTAKAVERIPQYLGQVKSSGINFKWVLVGNGVQAETVALEIEKAGIQKETIWIKDYMSHEEILQLFSISDFYILFHKYSIFDLSTLEAMYYGGIPILTPVGGNLEVIKDGSGLFVSDFNDTAGLIDILDGDLDEMKMKNRAIQKEYFDDKAFLKRYTEFCDSMEGNKK